MNWINSNSEVPHLDHEKIHQQAIDICKKFRIFHGIIKLVNSRIHLICVNLIFFTNCYFMIIGLSKMYKNLWTYSSLVFLQFDRAELNVIRKINLKKFHSVSKCGTQYNIVLHLLHIKFHRFKYFFWRFIKFLFKNTGSWI